MKHYRTQRGFILMEVIVAVSLVAIGLFVLIESLSRCLAAARSVQTYSLVATMLANKSYEFRVERSENYQDVDGLFDDYPGYSWQRKFEKTGIDGLYQQTITINWRERNKIANESVVEYRYVPKRDKPK